jgi:LacI family transcriptional regulator
MSNPTQPRRILLLIETSRAYGRGIVEGVARYSKKHGPWSIQFEERALDSPPPAWLDQWQGDGVILRTNNLQLDKRLREIGKPLVELHGHPKIGVAQVRTDGQLGVRMVVEHFVGCGLQNFAYFSKEEGWWIDVNREHFVQALKEIDRQCHVYRPIDGNDAHADYSEQQRRHVIEWLRSLPSPVGIYTAGDLQAAWLLDACQEAEIAVPGQVAVMGVGNDSVICETARPMLSSLDLNARRIGYEAARLLDKKMAGLPADGTVYIPPSHVAVRQSTNLMVVDDPDVADAMSFIRNHACESIDVSDVAEKVGLSRRVLERRFRQHLGRTPLFEILHFRIERAKSLLTKTNLPKERVASKSGFASLDYFNRVFRREVGMTPFAYRRAYHESRKKPNNDEK